MSVGKCPFQCWSCWAPRVTPPKVSLPEIGQGRAPARQSCRSWGSCQTFPVAFCPKPESGFGVSEIAEEGKYAGFAGIPSFHVSGDVWKDILTLHCPVAVLKCPHSSSAAHTTDCCATQTLVSCFPGEQTSLCAPSAQGEQRASCCLLPSWALLCCSFALTWVGKVCSECAPGPPTPRWRQRLPVVQCHPWEWELGMGQEKGTGKLQGAAARGVRHQKHTQTVRLEVQYRTQFSGNLQHEIYDNKKPVGVSSLLIFFFFFKLILMLR